MTTSSFATWLAEQQHRRDEVGLLARQIELMEGWSQAKADPARWKARLIEAMAVGKLARSFIQATDEWEALGRGVPNFRDWLMTGQRDRNDNVGKFARKTEANEELASLLYDVAWCDHESRKEPQTASRRALAQALGEWRAYAGADYYSKLPAT